MDLHSPRTNRNTLWYPSTATRNARGIKNKLRGTQKQRKLRRNRCKRLDFLGANCLSVMKKNSCRMNTVNSEFALKWFCIFAIKKYQRIRNGNKLIITYFFLYSACPTPLLSSLSFDKASFAFNDGKRVILNEANFYSWKYQNHDHGSKRCWKIYDVWLIIGELKLQSGKMNLVPGKTVAIARQVIPRDQMHLTVKEYFATAFKIRWEAREKNSSRTRRSESRRSSR